jgi:hypothetical protein
MPHPTALPTVRDKVVIPLTVIVLACPSGFKPASPLIPGWQTLLIYSRTGSWPVAGSKVAG